MGLAEQTNALSKLTESIEQQRMLREESITMALFGAVLDGLGGVDQLAKLFIADFQKCRQTDKAKLVLEYHKLLRTWAEARDKVQRETSDLSKVSEDDLKSIVSELAIGQVLENDDFRRRVICEVGRRDPSEIDELIAMLQAARDGQPIVVLSKRVTHDDSPEEEDDQNSPDINEELEAI